MLFRSNTKLRIPVGDFLIGRIIDALGNPIDGKGHFPTDSFYTVENKAINPFERKPIDTQINLGIKAIDGLLTMGKGQRMGIFAEIGRAHV